MAFAQGSRSQLTYISEVTFGTTPGTPAMILLPVNTHSLNLKKALVESAEIRGDRQVAVSRHGNRSVAGDIVVELRADDYDALLESALFGAFTSGVLKLGTTFKSFSFEDGMLDVAKYRKFTGCAVNTLNLDIKPNAMVLATFGIIGKDGPAATGTSLDASPTASSGNAPFDSFSGTISEGGSSIATVTGLKLTIENGLNPTMVIGSPTAPQLEYGRGKVSGEVTAYFDDITLYNKFVNETTSDLTFSLTDGLTGNTYTFDLPKIKFNSGDMPLQNEQSRLLTMQIQGLYNSSDGTTLSITKS
jgi:hypothetical protein